jgi:hypothetical protein
MHTGCLPYNHSKDPGGIAGAITLLRPSLQTPRERLQKSIKLPCENSKGGNMAAEHPVHESILRAIGTIQEFIKTVTGQEATPNELAGALTRYFVMNEIKEFIELERMESGS